MKQSESSTRASLVAAGRKLFADNGFDGASVRDLCALAGANLGAVTYHFRTKQALYGEVIDSTVAPMADRLVAAATGPGAPLDRAEAVVRAHFAYLRDHPELPRLLVRSLLDTGMPPAAALTHLRRVMAAARLLIEEGQRDGSIRPGHPIVMALGLMSQSLHLTMLRASLGQLGAIDLADQADSAQVLDNIVRSVRGGLAAGAEAP
ncbi:MAG: TetR/AcrR family transcriptional regulator [Gemmatimonadetes bacterium]|nr:TetR/AcrR family transcriptional regulator [Gemmatimonadota bacterium]MCC7132883.1 TetR/AcrR family transcriptional regulator [Gemmatimonadales bacterium]